MTDGMANIKKFLEVFISFSEENESKTCDDLIRLVRIINYEIEFYFVIGRFPDTNLSQFEKLINHLDGLGSKFHEFKSDDYVKLY